MKRIIGFLLLIALFFGNCLAHSGKPKHHVIIDTDGAIDDMRAICMLLSGNDIRVLAITCSQGTLNPEEVSVKVRSLLKAFHHEGIPVGMSKKIPLEPPAWATTSMKFKWADESGIQTTGQGRNSMEVLNRTLEDYPEKVTLIALGSLKTYADWLKSNNKAAGMIDRVIWYNHHSVKDGFNYRVSPESYRYMKQSNILLEVVAATADPLMLNGDYLKQMQHTGSVYAQQIRKMITRSFDIDTQNQNHLHFWDDLVVLYLVVPILFDIEKDENTRLVSLSQSVPDEFLYETIGKLLASATETNNRVFTVFPTDPGLYKAEYAAILKKTIEKFGLIEWKAICMTNEIHGHTGIYSIIGAKMGIRAMEYFNLGVNNLEVISLAGEDPPLSCFNDGIQISNGATLGQGLISISDSVSAVPSAIFTFNRQSVFMALKEEIAEQMQDDIRYGIQNYGLQSDDYWLYIEKLALKYWEVYDRHEIFEIKNLPIKGSHAAKL